MDDTRFTTHCQVVIVLCTNLLVASEGSEQLWNENYVTNIIVHIHYIRRSKIMKRIYRVQCVSAS